MQIERGDVACASVGPQGNACCMEPATSLSPLARGAGVQVLWPLTKSQSHICELHLRGWCINPLLRVVVT